MIEETQTPAPTDTPTPTALEATQTPVPTATPGGFPETGGGGITGQGTVVDWMFWLAIGAALFVVGGASMAVAKERDE